MNAACPRTEATAEHRFLSVLFCDLMDSTGHQYRMEPEDFAGVLSPYRQLVFDIVGRHGGHVARVIGDGVLAYFGWPRGSGRDAEAAVFSALAIGEQMGRFGEGRPATSAKLAVRMAVETGWVLVGNVDQTRSRGASGLEQGDVVGHAPNVAARLQRLALPNGVVVGEATLPLLGRRFKLEPVDTTGLDLPVPVQAAHVTGRSVTTIAIRGMGGGPDGPFVGRDHEISALDACWEEVKAGRGQLVLVSGEPGIGKSRLAVSVVASRKIEARVVVLTCTEARIDTAFQPVAEQLTLAMGLATGASAQTIDTAARRFAARFRLSTGADAIAAVLGVVSPQISPPALREATFRALIEIAVKLSSDRPLLLLVEDLQWADASTFALIQRLSERLASLRIMLMATHRSDWHPTWPAGVRAHKLALSPLPTDAAARLVEALVGELDQNLKAEIVERSEGIPFFISEFARATADGEKGMRLPGSISQLLAARLDSAGSARDLVQYLSVVGREIDADLMADLSGLPADGLGVELDRLLELGIMMRSGDGDKARFAFCHALLADAAYEALTTPHRQALHRQVADALRTRNPAIGSSEPEVLGRHLALGGDTASAVALYQAAGTNALRAAAFVESAAHARRAQEFATTLSGADAKRAELAAMVLLGEALSGTHGYASDDVHTVFEAANRIALELGSVEDLRPAMRGLTAYYQIRGPLHRAHELGRRTVQVARMAGDHLQLGEAERRWGWCKFCQGQFDEARLLVESAMRRLESFNSMRLENPVVDDTIVRGPVILALIAWLVDGDTEALRIADVIAGSAETFPRPMTAVYGLSFASFIQQLCGKPGPARLLATLGGEIARGHSNPYWISLSDIVCGWSDVVSGGAEGVGYERLCRGLQEYERTQSTIMYPYALMLLAEAEHARGETQAALSALQRGLDCAETIGAEFYSSLLEAVRGRILLNLDADAARDALARARLAAVRQGAIAHVRRIETLLHASG